MTLSRFISCGLSLECRQSQSCNLSAGIDIDCCSPSRQVDQDPAMTSNTVQFRCQCSTVICMRFSQPCRDIAFLTKVFILEEAVTESNVVERQAQSSGTKVKRTCSFVGTAVTPWESNHDQVSPFPGLCAFAGTLHHTLQKALQRLHHTRCRHVEDISSQLSVRSLTHSLCSHLFFLLT